MNQGNKPASDEFWVDLYIDPNPPPAAANDVWNDGRCIHGIAWGVTDPVAPGQTVTLVFNGTYYWPYPLSNFPGSLQAGQGVLAYAQVDAANDNTDYGGVLESHEPPGSGPDYNNILSKTITIPTLAGSENRQPEAAHNLPSRP